MKFLDDRVPGLIWTKLAPCPMSGCWLWTGALHSHGYGVMRVGGITKYVAHVLHEVYAGPLPDGMQLKNLCEVRCCANPSHWRSMTRKAMARMWGNGRKTHCKNGHEFTLENTYVRWGGRRTCLACGSGRARLSERAKQWRRENSLRSRLMYRFGMTADDLEAMWRRQGGRCEVCHIEMVRAGGRRESMHIDHDHASGVVRGLLCMLCNNALGCLKDNPAAARSAAEYLERFCNREALQRRGERA